MVSDTSPRGIAIKHAQVDTMRNRIERVTEDLKDLNAFYPMRISPRRTRKLKEYLTSELESLQSQPFDRYDQQGKIDYLLLRNYLERQLRDLQLDYKQNQKSAPLLPFADGLLELCEARTKAERILPQSAAQKLFEANAEIKSVIDRVERKPNDIHIEKTSAFRAAQDIDSLQASLKEWFDFYSGYDPIFDWWVAQPYGVVDKSLKETSEIIRNILVGIDPGKEDTIVGNPIGLDGLLSEISAESIAYTPEDLISIGEKEFKWCINELKKASRMMGFQDDWKQALEEVKKDVVEPGKQTELVRDLVREAISFVEENQLVTVPTIAKENWQMFMMSPERQKVNPFFLGGESIIVSYPTGGMDHEAKLMSMRGNNIHFSRATVFHEMIPGHHLQMHVIARSRPYRRLFDTPFWIEGWALYWEFVLWNDDRFSKTPQNRIGMLFWRLHRCARIIFSIKFHLGQMSPQECIDLLIDEVGHERATAEGEVRRSLNGDYSPLYQAGYMLGALQIYSLRKEVVETGQMTEKDFHDRFLRENCMPIELMRALIQDQPLSCNHAPSWKFCSF
ncbi:hypothetical protein MYU51_018983 [Penicillium brevicompactum]|uniref:uncharacterized protein n=1 Tax=Penicillium brevicompactum TaxID=5074 RepID=UPI0025410287|nr:uncharacterized protein N7506_006339 [Penicillium brevicompactum]KAJ5332556.1 hypothetical protein N7506_006339 [Penicillium brevicompactum]